MAWETRSGRKYAYRSFRDAHGRVRKEYLGRGDAAVEAETMRSGARAARKAEAAAVLELAAAVTPLDQLGEELDAGVDALVAAVLRSKGFRQHKGSWRKQRGENKHA